MLLNNWGNAYEVLGPGSALNKQLNSLFIIIISVRRDTHSLIYSISTNCVPQAVLQMLGTTGKEDPKQNKMVKVCTKYHDWTSNWEEKMDWLWLLQHKSTRTKEVKVRGEFVPTGRMGSFTQEVGLELCIHAGERWHSDWKGKNSLLKAGVRKMSRTDAAWQGRGGRLREGAGRHGCVLSPASTLCLNSCTCFCFFKFQYAKNYRSLKVKPAKGFHSLYIYIYFLVLGLNFLGSTLFNWNIIDL